MSEHFHLIGIGGIGMSGLAKILLSRKQIVSGSDLASSYVTEGLVRDGAKVVFGHASENIAPAMTVVFSSDIKEDNPEMVTAKKYACPLWHRSDMLAHLMKDSESLVVAGTHGKTTTTSLLACTLIEAGLDPSYAIGGIPVQLQTNAANGSGKYFVAEGDESDGTFLKYNPFGAIVTNIDFDHMNFYLNEETLVKSFKQFMQQVQSPQHLLWCGDDPRLVQLAMPGISYGFGKNCILRVENAKQTGWKTYFDVHYEGDLYQNIELSLIGKHNISNALAVFGLALRIGISEEVIRKAFKNFKGVRRRCEPKGEVRNVLVLDDYAHHPTEIAATLKGIRQAIGERRLIAVFQPHRYSRMKDVMGTFGNCFVDADEVIVTDLYASGEQPIPGVTTDKIYAEIASKMIPPTQYVPRQYLSLKLSVFCRPHDVVVTLGAGDITKLGPELVDTFKQQPPRKLKMGLLFGGRSVEHEISILSARNIASKMDPEVYDLKYFSISKQGEWATGAKAQEILNEKVKQVPKAEKPEKIPADVLQELQSCDILFPILHGPFGEDGTVQGFAEILGIPYVGCDATSAAIAMNKVRTKQILTLRNIPNAPFVDFDLYTWRNNGEKVLEVVLKKLPFPLFVKPVHLGSSVGVSKVENKASLMEAIDKAFLHDTHVMVEQGIKGRELEFAVLGNDSLFVFPPGEILTSGQVYSYESKYLPGGAPTTPKAEISQEVLMKGVKVVAEAYKAIGCQGMARIDCFLDEKNDIIVSEVNPIPGFTNTSLFPQMCAVNNLSGQELMHRLAILGLHKKRRQDALVV